MAATRRWWTALASAEASPAARTRDRLRGVALIVVSAFAVLAAISFSAPWRLLEARVFDYLSTLSPPPRPADGPIIVAIDEPSFAELGLQWPWPRDIHGRLVEALRDAGARVIGLDIIFAEPSAKPGADAALAAALGPDVVLAADETLIDTPLAVQTIRVEPLPALTDTGAKSGIASIVLDRDGTLRRVPRYPDGFAAMLLDAGGIPYKSPAPGVLLQSFGPARTYETVSYYQALEPAAFLPPGFFFGRTVIVGLSMQSAPTTDAGGADAFATPQTLRTGRLVAGAEIHATIYDNLRAGLFVRPAAGALSLGAIAAAAGLAGLAVRRSTGWPTVVAGIVTVAACIAGSWTLLRFGRFFVPPIAPAVAFAGVAAAQGARDYAAEFRLRQGITRAFSQYLSPVLVERLASDPSQLHLGGERRTLTVLFCDVRGFTTISERLRDDPQRLTTLINRLLNPLSAVILTAGGTIDKYIGDAIMAFWNAPLDDPEHAEKAVGAAVGMLAAVDALNAELAAEAIAASETPIEIRIGIGINTGDCVVGNMGSDVRFNYSVLGDPVNLASRLEGETKVYGVPILIGDETARRLSGRYPAIELDRVLVKGKTEAAVVHTVLGVAGAVAAIDDAARAAHQAFLDDFYAGRKADAAARIDRLARQLPTLATYYERMRAAAAKSR
ncbi:MAG TPA: adenylate/guanylate cyclase domain-containing protein [Rhizobiales bacterium]|nr:adenylate/guanylate cyclase domain-containing protein [Hyphomicrobiales bacterium]